MTSVTSMRTGTALAVKLRSAQDREDPGVDRILRQLQAYLELQHAQGHVELYQCEKRPDGQNLMVIPKPQYRSVLDMAERVVEQLDHLKRSDLHVYRWEA